LLLCLLFSYEASDLSSTTWVDFSPGGRATSDLTGTSSILDVSSTSSETDLASVATLESDLGLEGAVTRGISMIGGSESASDSSSILLSDLSTCSYIKE
jgi:hypothetical protein